jgi:hypothetical protein
VLTIGCGVFAWPFVCVETTQEHSIASAMDAFMTAMANPDVSRAYALFSTYERQFTPIAELQRLQDYQVSVKFQRHKIIEVLGWHAGWSILAGPRALHSLTAQISGHNIFTGGEKPGFNAAGAFAEATDPVGILGKAVSE